VELGKTGVYHIAGRDIVSRYEFAVRLARFFGYNPALIKPVKTADLVNLRRAAPFGLVTLKAETELGITPATIEQGLAVLKSQLSRTANWENDSRPVPCRIHANRPGHDPCLISDSSVRTPRLPVPGSLPRARIRPGSTRPCVSDENDAISPARRILKSKKNQVSNEVAAGSRKRRTRPR
jgi:hypothetical protein